MNSLSSTANNTIDKLGNIGLKYGFIGSIIGILGGREGLTSVGLTSMFTGGIFKILSSPSKNRT